MVATRPAWLPPVTGVGQSDWTLIFTRVRGGLAGASVDWSYGGTDRVRRGAMAAYAQRYRQGREIDVGKVDPEGLVAADSQEHHRRSSGLSSRGFLRRGRGRARRGQREQHNQSPSHVAATAARAGWRAARRAGTVPPSTASSVEPPRPSTPIKIGNRTCTVWSPWPAR